jgi:hypothetical protein
VEEDYRAEICFGLRPRLLLVNDAVRGKEASWASTNTLPLYFDSAELATYLKKFNE